MTVQTFAPDELYVLSQIESTAGNVTRRGGMPSRFTVVVVVVVVVV